MSVLHSLAISTFPQAMCCGCIGLLTEKFIFNPWTWWRFCIYHPFLPIPNIDPSLYSNFKKVHYDTTQQNQKFWYHLIVNILKISVKRYKIFLKTAFEIDLVILKLLHEGIFTQYISQSLIQVECLFREQFESNKCLFLVLISSPQHCHTRTRR